MNEKKRLSFDDIAEEVENEYKPSFDDIANEVEKEYSAQEQPREKTDIQQVINRAGGRFGSVLKPTVAEDVTGAKGILGGIVGSPERLYRTAGAVVGTGADVAGTTLKEFAQLAGKGLNFATGGASGKAISGIKDVTRKGIETISNNDIVSSSTEKAKEYWDSLPESVKANYIASGELSGLIGMGGASGISKFAKSAIPKSAEIATAIETTSKPIVSAVKDAGKVIASPILKEAEYISGAVKGITKPSLDKTLEKGVLKGIVPDYKGSKRTIKGREQYVEKGKEAFKIIAENRDNVQVFDDVGREITRPKSLNDMSKFIPENKQELFNEFNGMSKLAGDNGIKVNLDDLKKQISDEFIPPEGKILSADDKRRIYTKEHINHAKEVLNDIENINGATPEVIEAKVAQLNKSLSGIYGSAVQKQNAEFDLSVASKLRKSLDKSISQLGEGYQEAKNKYGALRAIEDDVNKRALIEARKKDKSLHDFVDAFTGGDMVVGIVTANPELLLKGATGKGITEYYKYINKPDTYINKAFKQAYKDVPARPKNSYLNKMENAIEEQKTAQAAKEAAQSVEPDLDIPTYKRQNKNLYSYVKSLETPLEKKYAGKFEPVKAESDILVNRAEINPALEAKYSESTLDIPKAKDILEGMPEKLNINPALEERYQKDLIEAARNRMSGPMASYSIKDIKPALLKKIADEEKAKKELSRKKKK